MTRSAEAAEADIARFVQLCPECAILRDEELILEAYEVLWDAIPELRAAQDAGIAINCPECGRQLTFEDRGEGVR